LESLKEAERDYDSHGRTQSKTHVFLSSRAVECGSDVFLKSGTQTTTCLSTDISQSKACWSQ